jgi:acetyltransferase-like isoleucine patch superfamily enzyme
VRLFARLLRKLAILNRRFEGRYRRWCRPGGREWAEMLRERGDFYSMGRDCAINPYAQFENPALVRFGNNVRLGECHVLCSDGSVNMINRAFGLKLDYVGKVDFRDNVFIGYRAIILPGVTIGPNAIVSTGSVVRSDVAEGDIVAGVPARRVGRLDMTVAMLKAKNEQYPWKHLIERRANEYDRSFESELTRLRVKYFFGGDKQE